MLSSSLPACRWRRWRWARQRRPLILPEALGADAVQQALNPGQPAVLSRSHSQGGSRRPRIRGLPRLSRGGSSPSLPIAGDAAAATADRRAADAEVDSCSRRPAPPKSVNNDLPETTSHEAAAADAAGSCSLLSVYLVSHALPRATKPMRWWRQT